MTSAARSQRSHGRNVAKTLLFVACAACAFAAAPQGASAGRPPTATPVVPDAVPAVTYDPALVARVGVTYARYRFDLSRAFAPAQVPAPTAAPAPALVKRLDVHFSSAIDDQVRERIVATLANGDPERSKTLQSLFANDEFLNHAAEAIRIFGLHETDLADVTSALVVAGYDATHSVALTEPQIRGLARDVRAALLASPVLATLDNATKQSIATEMSYQILFWEFDADVFGGGGNPTSFARLHESIATSLAVLGVPLGALRPTDVGVEAAPPNPPKNGAR